MPGGGSARTLSNSSSGSRGSGWGGGKGGGWGVPSWSAVSGFATGLLSGAASAVNGGVGYGLGSDGDGRNRRKDGSGRPAHRHADSWGPEPPGQDGGRPKIEDVAAGTHSDREAALRAARTASLLEGSAALDVHGRGAAGLWSHKKRASGDDTRTGSWTAGFGSGTAAAAASGGASGAYHDSVASSGTTDGQEEPLQLVYVHAVAPRDTYAGIVLRYRIVREDAFRRTNGLWSKDDLAIQARRWIAVPVDACDVVGRPCEAPDGSVSGEPDLLASTPDHTSSAPQQQRDGDLGLHLNGDGKQQPPTPRENPDQPWTHVRWVTLDGFPRPVEIGRVSRRAMGFFPPRRRRRVGSTGRTSTTLSSPRQSLDGPSSDAGKPASPGMSAGSGTGTPTRTRVSSLIGPSIDNAHRDGSLHSQSSIPRWMRRPGGVGTLTASSRSSGPSHRRPALPGPERDVLNAFATRHFPSIVPDAESMPSMSVMGAETARIGLLSHSPSSGSGIGIVESPSLAHAGDELASLNHLAAAARTGAGGSGSGPNTGMLLDRAANAVEQWVRVAVRSASAAAASAVAGAKHASGSAGTPVLGPRKGSMLGGSPARGGLSGGDSMGSGQGALSLLDDPAASDLIELADSNDDDGRWMIGASAGSGAAADASGWSNGGGVVPRGRSAASGAAGRKGKAD